MHASTVASLAVPVSAARTVAGKVAVATLERVLPAALLLIDENRGGLVEWFPNWGPRMLYYADKYQSMMSAAAMLEQTGANVFEVSTAAEVLSFLDTGLIASDESTSIRWLD
jgi:hypothetical protein